MKFLVLLFALYTITLSCVPCICEDNCADEKTEQPDSKGKQKDDDCTTFCNCSCCHSVINTLKTTSLVKKAIHFSGKFKFSLLDQHFTSYNCHNIWQPPKLV